MKASGVSDPSSRLNVPTGTRTVFLFGGTFDPPHLAHVKIASAAARAVDPEAWIVYVPAARSPFKMGGPVATDAARVRMLELATEEDVRAVVWNEEVRRAGASYTIETVRAAVSQLGEATELRLLIGSDQAAAFHRWRDARELVRLTRPIVMLRSPHRSGDNVIETLRAARFWTDEELEGWRGRISSAKPMPVAATEVRERIERGEPDLELLRELHPDVLTYIREHGLYRSLR